MAGKTATRKRGSSSSAKPANGSSSSSSSAKAAPAPSDCPFCVFGTPVERGSDENGTSFTCLSCGTGYTHPATAEAQAAELATIHEDASEKTVAAIARRYGVEPADYPKPGELRSVLIDMGEGA